MEIVKSAIAQLDVADGEQPVKKTKPAEAEKDDAPSKPNKKNIRKLGSNAAENAPAEAKAATEEAPAEKAE